MSKISLQNTVIDAILALSEGNPGAIQVCKYLMEVNPIVDPQNAMGFFGALFLLDSFKIYGSRIWMLYKDVCNQDIVHMIACLRACQMGIISKAKLDFAIENIGEGIDPRNCCNMVMQKLTKFNRHEASLPTFNA